MDPLFTGSIIPVAFDYAPPNWAVCNGQLLQISQHVALFSLLDTRYGGDGVTTFALPDLVGRTVIGAVQGTPGIGAMPIGEAGQTLGSSSNELTLNGTATATIALENLPQMTMTGNVSGASLTVLSTLNATSKGPGTPIPAGGAMLSDTGTGTGNGTGAVYYTSHQLGPSTEWPKVALNTASVLTTVSGNSATFTTNLGQGIPLTCKFGTNGLTLSPMQPSLALNYIICVNGIYPDFT